MAQTLPATEGVVSNSRWKRRLTSTRVGRRAIADRAGPQTASAVTAAGAAAPRRAVITVSPACIMQRPTAKQLLRRQRGGRVPAAKPLLCSGARGCPTAPRRRLRLLHTRRELFPRRAPGTRQLCSSLPPLLDGAVSRADLAAQPQTRRCLPAQPTCPRHPFPRWGLHQPASHRERPPQGCAKPTCSRPPGRAVGFESATRQAARFLLQLANSPRLCRSGRDTNWRCFVFV